MSIALDGRIDRIKRIVERANLRGDTQTVQAGIDILEEIWQDHRAAQRFYTMLELQATHDHNDRMRQAFVQICKEA